MAFNALHGSCSGRERGDEGNFVFDRGPSYRILVIPRFLAKRSVDDKLDLSVLHNIDDVGSTLVDLENVRSVHVVFLQEIVRAFGRNERESEVDKVSGNPQGNIVLVAVVDADEDGPAVR